MEFNPDGSLKLPEKILKAKEENNQRMKGRSCIKIRRDVVNFTAPKKCVLAITLSEGMQDSRFIENIFKEFKENAQTPLKLEKRNEKEFNIEVGSDFRRCTDCQTLRGMYREFLNGNFIDEKGNCTYEKVYSERKFEYEDYFE